MFGVNKTLLIVDECIVVGNQLIDSFVSRVPVDRNLTESLSIRLRVFHVTHVTIASTVDKLRQIDLGH